MELKEHILQLAHQYYEEVRNIRRHLHKYPELSFQEYDTATYLENQLGKMGLESSRVAGTGLTGTLGKIDEQMKTVALRADIDALPVFEKNKLEYSSKHEGRMHACGHDAHSAMLIGVLKILRSLDDQYAGNIRYIFQPGEEKLPGGAKKVIEEGLLEHPRPDLILGQHVYPELETGHIGFRPGPYMASTDEVYLTIKGQGGHGAMPHQYDDTVYLATQLIQSLQQVVSRKAPPTIPTVLSFGKIIANGATNVIPDEVYLEGTFRTMNEEWRNRAHQLIHDICRATFGHTQAWCEVDIVKGYPVLENHEEFTRHAIEYSKELWGRAAIDPLTIRMTAEDFAYYTQNIPGVFYRLGVASKEKGIDSPLHASTFNIDEEAMITGMANMAWLTISFLKRWEP